MLYVYAHTPNNGWWFSTVAVNGGGSSTLQGAPSGAPQVQILTPTESQDISQLQRQFVISGTVSDAANTTIDVWIDGERNAPGATDLGTATPGSDGSWLLVFNPSQFRTDHHNLRAYALDRSTAMESETLVGFNIVNH